MKKSISDLYEQILLNEAEKNSLQNPSNDEVGELPSENMFGTVPDTMKGEGPEKAKLQKGPSYNKVDSGTPVAAKQPTSKMPNSKPAAPAAPKKSIEMEDEEVVPDNEEEDENHEKINKQKPQKESFTMSAFEELFKKTLQEELQEEPVELETSEEEDEMDLDSEEDEDMSEEEQEEENQEEEEDLLSDLRNLQDKLNSILNKLENLEAEEGEEEEGEEYTDDEFDDEFEDEDEEAPVKESLQAGLKPVNKSKIKTLQNKKNKVGRVSPKGGKSKLTKMKITANPTALGDKKKDLQKHNNKVKSSVDKGDFFK